jgi:single-stranded-DNA-specific exonuclease
MEIELSRMTWDLLRALEALEPCGYGNPHPLFLSKNVAVRYQRAVGKEGRHLKLTLSDGNTFWDAIAFRQGEWANKLPDHIDVVYKLEVNEWNGQRNLQLNVQDLRPPGIDEFGARQWLLGEPSE